MASSGSYDFNLNRDEIIGQAYIYLGATGIGETPTADEITDAGRTLNIMLKSWQTEGIFLWLNQQITLFLAYGQESYLLGTTGDNASASVVKTEMKVAGVATDSTIDVDSITGISDGDYIGIELDDGTVQWTTINGTPSGNTITLTAALTDASAVDNHVYTYTTKTQRPLEILEARRVSSDGTETPLTPVSREEYMSLSTKDSTGISNQYWYDPQLNNGKLYLWSTTSDVKDTINMTIKRPIQDFDSDTDTGDFPVEWLEAVITNLAVRIGIKLGIEISAGLASLAAESKYMAKTFNNDTGSIFFQYDEEF
jgi:hypothetical protein